MLRSLFRTVFWIIALLALVISGYRIAAELREQLTADELRPETGRFVDTVHGRIHALEAGPADGLPVLLIHGSVGWAGLWADTMEDLAARGYRAIAIDLPPMGLSDRDNFTDYSRQAQGLRILAFVEAADIKPIIVAHSFGAGAAVEALMAQPRAFEGAVIVAGALALGEDGEGREMPWLLGGEVEREIVVANTVTNPHLTRPLLSRFVHRSAAITDAHIAAIQYPFGRIGSTDTIAAWLPTLLVPPRGAASSQAERYAGINLPVALIWGEEDTVTPPSQAQALQAALGDAPIYWLDDVGHIPQIEAPVAFHDVLGKALSEIETQN
ncbi:alpha/beta fold hydrolase [Rhodobacteraceae bacterium]|nr:alpha/beta fold hydrolase [Paracoccaceae bacterium]